LFDITVLCPLFRQRSIYDLIHSNILLFQEHECEANVLSSFLGT